MRRRERAARARTREAASGLDITLESMPEENREEEEGDRTGGTALAPQENYGDTPPTREGSSSTHQGVRPTVPTITDRWGNVISIPGYQYQYPDWVLDALRE